MVTETSGRSTLGESVMLVVANDTIPTAVNMMKSTIDGIGRRIAQAEILPRIAPALHRMNGEDGLRPPKIIQ
jgi:hypothetical protein